jgi:peroxiredoxin
MINSDNERLVKLSNFKGKQLVILAFPQIFPEKQYCPRCFPHIKALNKNYQQFTSRGGEVLIIISTNKRQSQKVVTDLGLKMSLLSNPGCGVFQAYHVGQALERH